MSVYRYPSLLELVTRLRDDFHSGGQNFVLLYAYNGTGKTRLSMAFKEAGKTETVRRDTLYFNAFTEDLFTWDNDLNGDSERVLKMNTNSRFFDGLNGQAMDTLIQEYLRRYVDFDFAIDYENGTVRFSRDVPGATGTETVDNIKVSRGEENMFVWCFFLAIVRLVLDGAEAYNWVKYIYIDDPISSLDDNNAIAVACDLTQLLKTGTSVKTVISSHHGLFFNIICNELRRAKHKRYFLQKSRGAESYILRGTENTPFFHHVALLGELRQAIDSGVIHTYHFNTLRTILEKTASFLGYDGYKDCIHGLEDEVLFNRALNLLSHGGYSIYEPREMGEDTKDLFKRVFNAFVDRYQFRVPELAVEESAPADQS